MGGGALAACQSTPGSTSGSKQQWCWLLRTGMKRCKVRTSFLFAVYDISTTICPTVDDVDTVTDVANSSGMDSRKRKASSPIVINLISDDEEDAVPLAKQAGPAIDVTGAQMRSVVDLAHRHACAVRRFQADGTVEYGATTTFATTS